jgi:hypothetical protein
MPKAVQQFAKLPHVTEDDRLYAVQFSNGMVKVGVTRYPRSRLLTHRSRAQRQFGAHVTAWRLVSTSAISGYQAERKLLIALGVLGTPVKNAGEFFLGVRFRHAVTLMRRIASKAA